MLLDFAKLYMKKKKPSEDTGLSNVAGCSISHYCRQRLEREFATTQGNTNGKASAEVCDAARPVIAVGELFHASFSVWMAPNGQEAR